jgi:hypothetical protein
MNFQIFVDPITGCVRDDMIWYVDESGQKWCVPQGHRFWDLYQQSLKDGNEPLPAE